MEHLKSIGTVVYLKASYDTINSRLGNLAGRGVAIEKGQTLHDLYDERVKLYEKYADVTVVIDDRTIEIVTKLLHNVTRELRSGYASYRKTQN